MSSLNPTSTAPAAPSLSPEQQAMAGAQQYEKSVGETEKKWDGTLQSDRAAEVQAMNAPELTSSPPAPEQTDIGKAWASTAMIAAVLGGVFTRSHITTALNGMSAALQSFHQGDVEATKYNYEKWKAASENAAKRMEFVHQRLSDDVALMEDDYKYGKAKFDADSSAFGIQLQALQGRDEHLRVIADLQRTATELKSANMDMAIKGQTLDIYAKFQQARKDYAAAQQKGDKSGMAAAADEIKAASDAAQDWSTAQGKGGAMMMSDDDRASMGAAVAMGQPLNQIVPGYGKQSADMRAAARAQGIKQIQDETGMNATKAGQELTWREMNFRAAGNAENFVEKMKVTTQGAVKQLDYNLARAKAEMSKLGSSDASPVLNALARGKEKWTGNPAYTGLFFYMSAAMNEAAKITTGGVGSVSAVAEGARVEAQKWMDSDWTTPAQFDEAAQAIVGEGQNRMGNFTDMQTDIRNTMMGGGTSTGQFTPDPAWPSAGDVPDNKVLRDENGRVIAKSRNHQWVDPSTP